MVETWSLLNCVPYVLTCQHALCAYMLTCQCALHAYVLKCLACLRAQMLNVPCVLMCSHDKCVLHPYLLMCQRVLHAYLSLANVSCMLTCPNDNLPCMLTYQCSLHAYIPICLAFNRCYGKLFTIKWFDLCFSKTLKAIFEGTVMQIEKALINNCLSVSKVSWKFCILTICNFAVIYLWNLLFS